MLPISSQARAKLFSKSFTDRVEVRITPTYDGATTILFEDKDIVPSSLSIDKVCSSNKLIDIGTSMLNQLDIQLRYNFGENDFIGARVEVKYYLDLTMTTDELLATHVFFIDRIEQTTPKIATITAYCNLDLLSKNIGTRVFSGTPFSILDQINTALGTRVLDVPQGGSTPQEFEDLPNVDATLQLSNAENKCETYRDVVNTIGQLIGVFFQTTAGTTVAKPRIYHQDVDLTVGLSNRRSFTHNRYTTTFDGLIVKGTKGQYSSPANTEFNNPYEIADSPAWDYGTDAGLQARTDALRIFILDYEYTPATLTMWSEPTIECGDRINVVCDDGEYEMIVTQVTWNFKGNTVIKCAGEKSSSGQMGASGSSRSSSVSRDANTLVMYSVTNADELDLTATSEPKNLCRITFSTMGATEVMWFGEALINAILGSNPYVTIKATYKLDGAERAYYPKADYVTPNNVFSMFHTLQVEEQSAHIWEVWLEVLQGEVVINQFEFNGTLMGQNLVVNGNDWGGILSLFDDVARYVVTVLFGELEDSGCEVTLYTPHTRSLSDNVSNIGASVTFTDLNEIVTIKLTYEDIIFCHDGGYCGGGMLM